MLNTQKQDRELSEAWNLKELQRQEVKLKRAKNVMWARESFAVQSFAERWRGSSVASAVDTEGRGAQGNWQGGELEQQKEEGT